MLDYIVVDTSEPKGLMALLDRFGGYHVAHTQSALPELGATLLGTTAAPGPAELTEVGSGCLHRVDFEAVNCGQQSTFDML